MGGFDQNAAAVLAPQTGAQPWLEAFRDSNRQQWLASHWPDRKTEDWKYTTLGPLAQGDYLRFGQAGDTALDPPLYQVAGLACQRLVFVNGELAQDLCQLSATTSDCTITRFCDATDSQKTLIGQHLGTVAETQSNPFVSLNGSWLEDGVLFHVADNSQAPLPLHVVHLTTPGIEAFSVRQRLLVVLETNCEATVIEHFSSTDASQNCFVNGVSEFKLMAGARLTHYRLHLEQEQGIHIGGVYTQLQRDASVDSFFIGMGSHLKRLDLRLQHQGPGSHAQLNGVYLSKGKQHIDIHSTVEHESPQGTTSEVVRGIVDDEARAVFNGRIHIHPDAQKTLADLSNRNLLLTNTAEVYTKPELEIYADDVRCSHGATVSQIDDLALYYCQSRGIERKQAEVMLSFGFINELIDALRHEPIQQLLRPILSHWFGTDSRTTRQLP
jgi:Fe-S cluster assembly protein SufD